MVTTHSTHTHTQIDTDTDTDTRTHSHTHTHTLSFTSQQCDVLVCSCDSAYIGSRYSRAGASASAVGGCWYECCRFVVVLLLLIVLLLMVLLHMTVVHV